MRPGATGIPLGSPGAWLTVSRVGALAVAGIAAWLGVRGSGPSLQAEVPRPASRVIVWAFDGVGADDVSYYASLRPRSALATLVAAGASAYVEWEPSPPRRAWRHVWSPVVLRETPTPGAALRREVTRHWPLSAGEGGTSSIGVLDAVAAAGAGVARVGWWRDVAPPSVPGPSIPEGTWGEIRRRQGRDPGLPRIPLPESVEITPELRDLARLPHEEWEAGAETADTDRAVFATAQKLGADPVTWWVDRFRSRVALMFVEKTDYPLHLAVF